DDRRRAGVGGAQPGAHPRRSARAAPWCRRPGGAAGQGGWAEMRIRAGYVDSDWGQVHYRTAGTSGPWVALFHESPLSSRVYDQVLPILGERARVVAFDTPGYGASDPPPRDGMEIPEYAAVLARAASALGMSDVVFGGVHTGASLAIEAARVFDRGARGLVLSGVPLFTPEERADYLANWTPQPP